MAQLSNEQIGQNVMNLREHSGMSMDKLADAMRARGHKWTRVTVFNIEHGERMLKVQEAFDLLDAMGIDQESGMRIITSENEGKRRVRAEIREIHEGLDGLRDAIAAIQYGRLMLKAFLPDPDGDDSDSADESEETAYGIQFMRETEEACKELHAEELLRYTEPEEIVRVVKDLLSVPDVKWIGEEGRSIKLWSGSEEMPLELIVSDEWNGETYRAEGPDESIIKD